MMQLLIKLNETIDYNKDLKEKVLLINDSLLGYRNLVGVVKWI